MGMLLPLLLDQRQTPDELSVERILYSFGGDETLIADIHAFATDGVDHHFWRFTFGARRVGEGDVEIVGSVATLMDESTAGAATWTMEIAAYDLLVVANVTGQAATNIDWRIYVDPMMIKQPDPAP